MVKGGFHIMADIDSTMMGLFPKNSKESSESKHIDLKCYIIREINNDGHQVIEHIVYQGNDCESTS